MKLVSYTTDGNPRPGALLGRDDLVLDIEALMPEITSIQTLIESGDDVLSTLTDMVKSPPDHALVSRADVAIVAPIPEPRRNIFCVGKNYHEHAKEFHDSGYDASAGKDAVPEYPIFFTKSFTTIIGPSQPIPASSDWTNSVDYEVELAVVIGKGGRNIKQPDAYDHVFGYTIINDVTSRTLQQQHKQWFLGKNFDGFCPMGPCLVTADEAGNINEMMVSAEVNGELRQQACVRDLIFDVPVLIETLSAVSTLMPGDIIATGTPAGVGLGFDPPKFLQADDTMTVSITGIGDLSNPVE